MSEIKLGSHVGMSGKDMFLGSVKEAASYGANVLMLYTGAPQNTRRKEIADLNIDDMSVVSSGVYERHFEENGVNYHHLLNPKTGYPYQNGLVAVTIVSPRSVDGDVLSTTCFSMGLDKGLELINSMDGIYAYFITDDYELIYSDGAEAFIDEIKEK